MSNSEKEKKSAPIIEDKITVKNYKCFDEKGAGFDRIMPINVIIGKNNSGKSSLIELIDYVISPNNSFIKRGRDVDTDVLVEHFLNEDEKRQIESSADIARASSFLSFDIKDVSTIPDKEPDNYDYMEVLRESADIPQLYSLKEKEKKDIKNFKGSGKLYSIFEDSIKTPFNNKKLYRVIAERDIQPEDKLIEPKLSNGVGFTNYIRNVLNKADLDSKIVEVSLLSALNNVLYPDIHFSRILVQEISSETDEQEKWEVFFEDSNNNKIALSRMGSGIKTILLVLLNLILLPKLEGIGQSNMVFVFEELENNLHPALQRRLFQYIKKYSEEHGCYFFLTTHSNVVIDVFGTYEHAQIIHVEHDGVRSTTRTILHDKDSKKVLRDLGVKASDLLQSNGVIWVEGPSDRNYLNKWIQLLAPELQEGLHYSIMPYGGRLLANLSFDFEWFNKEVIPLLKINTNSFVVMDRDGKEDDAKLNKTKERIKEEIGEGNYWVTEGREIENYLNDDVVKNWLKKYKVKADKFSNDKNTKIEDNISAAGKTIKLKYNSSKTVYSSEIVEYIDEKLLGKLDLKDRLNELIERIKEWNK